MGAAAAAAAAARDALVSGSVRSGSLCLRVSVVKPVDAIAAWLCSTAQKGALCNRLLYLGCRGQNVTIMSPTCVYPESAQPGVSRGALMKAVLISGGFVLFAASGAYAQPAATPNQASARAIVSQYCVGCHNDKSRSGDVSLAHLDFGHVENDA